MISIGVDLGGTKTMAVLVEDGRIIDEAKKSTPRVGGPDDVLDAIAAVVAKIDPDHRAPAIGVGVPGPVRPGTGVLPVARNLPGWDHDVDVAAGLAERCEGRRVVVDNDVNVGTLAEARIGAGAGVADLLGVFMGTGVGAGLVLDGRLRQGPRGVAGELGHAYVAFRDLHDAAVGRGELEDYAGRRMMEARARAHHDAGEATALVELVGDGRMKSSTWAKALEAEDPVAARLVDDATEAMAAALASAVALVDVELIVLGGGMAERLGEPFRADLEARVAARAFAGVGAPVRSAMLGDTGGALGAALLVEVAA
ncbi:MAG: ROK family protein [Acidimicrobiales bacterium]|nr:ROK family protein [Acidimicrobiales bacterium]